MTVEEAKERVSIGALWREFGYSDEPRKSCRCPFHEDKTPSFSIYENGHRWKCFTGCGEGDVIDFLARAKGLSNEEACREILRRAGGGANNGSSSGNAAARSSRPPRAVAGATRALKLVAYTADIAQRVADSRKLDITAIEFAALWLGTLSFGWVCDQRCWVLSDVSGKCAEARRIDGRAFRAVGDLKERKSHTVAGSCKSWPVGISPPKFEEKWLAQHVHKILLVEGGPDYLAACQLIVAQDENVLPVAMLGASASIDEGALRYFAGRDVTLVAHPDIDGRSASARWARQVAEAGGRARIFNLQQNDLCDVIASGATNDDLRLL